MVSKIEQLLAEVAAASLQKYFRFVRKRAGATKQKITEPYNALESVQAITSFQAETRVDAENLFLFNPTALLNCNSGQQYYPKTGFLSSTYC